MLIILRPSDRKSTAYGWLPRCLISLMDSLRPFLPNSRSQYLLAISLVPSSSSHWALFQRSPFLDSSSSLKGPQLVGGFLDGSVGIKLNKREERIWPEASKGLMQEDLHCSTYSAQVLGFCYVNFFLSFFRWICQYECFVTSHCNYYSSDDACVVFCRFSILLMRGIIKSSPLFSLCLKCDFVNSSVKFYVFVMGNKGCPSQIMHGISNY